MNENKLGTKDSSHISFSPVLKFSIHISEDIGFLLKPSHIIALVSCKSSLGTLIQLWHLLGAGNTRFMPQFTNFPTRFCGYYLPFFGLNMDTSSQNPVMRSRQ